MNKITHSQEQILAREQQAANLIDYGPKKIIQERIIKKIKKIWHSLLVLLGLKEKRKRKFRILFRRSRAERRENGRFVDKQILTSFSEKYKHLL